MPAITTLLLIGAGYLGDFGGRPLRTGTCGRRQCPPSPAARIASVTSVACDVTSARAHARTRPRIPTAGLACDRAVAALALAAQDLAVLAPLAALLRAHAVVQVVVASSTGVYDGLELDVVTAATPLVGITPRAQRLLQIEHWWRAQDLPCRIVRLAGLYGPGRIIGREAILQGRPLPGPAAGWLNLVRAEDAASAARRAGERTRHTRGSDQ